MAIETSWIPVKLTMCTDGSNRHGHGTTGSGLTGGHNTGTGLTGRNDNTGYGAGSTTAGPHSSNLANKADPRVDSDLGQSILLDTGSTRFV